MKPTSKASTYRARIRDLSLLGALSLVPLGTTALAATVPTDFQDQLVAGGLSLPVGFAFLPGGRVIVVEQKTAKIRLIISGAISSTDPVGTVPNVNFDGSERGLLGIAIDPNFPARPYIYTHANRTGSPTRVAIARFTLTGDLSGTGSGALTFDPASRYDLVNDIPDAAFNHNGGTLRFGPDGMLYVSLGEDAVPCAAQDTSSLRGVILRLDVSRLPAGPGSATRALITPADNPFATAATPNKRLIWAYGLRNPFRFHIDPLDGSLFIADVGQGNWEEVDRAPQGGMNFGWPIYEGRASYLGPGGCPTPGTLTGPLFVYDHGAGLAVMSAGVYRRPFGTFNGFPMDYEGNYFFADYYSGSVWRLKNSGSTWDLASPVAGQPAPDHWAEGFDGVSDYLVGPDGALWYCHQGNGQIRRVAYSGPDIVRPARAQLEP